MATVNVKITGDLGVKAVSEAWITINGEDITETGDYTYSGKTEFYVEAGHELGGNACLFYHNGNSVGSVVEEYKAYSFTVEHESSSDVAIVLTQTTSEVTVEITETTEPANPMAPHDGHNTNITDVAREIEGGTVLIGGVLREIENGLVLVGGVAREIGFDSSAKNYTVTITGSGAKDDKTPYACLVIDWTVYTTAQTLELPAGTVISCRVGRGTRGQAAVLLNGTAVAETAESYGEAWYDYTVNGNTTISLEVATGAIIRITTS